MATPTVSSATAAAASLSAASSSAIAAASASAAAAAAISQAATVAAEEAVGALIVELTEDAGESFGALLDGVLISFLLYGFACSQTWRYLSTYWSDSTLMKSTVVFVWLLNTAHRILDVQTLWFYVITLGNGNISNMESANWSMIVRLIPSEIAIACVQSFFVMRIWLFSGRKFVSWLLLIPILTSLALALVYIVRIFHFRAFTDSPKEKWIVIAYASVRMGADILISTVLTVLIYQKGKKSMTYLSNVLRTVIQYTITTGVLASSLAIIVLVTFLIMPSNLVYIAAYDVYGIVFFNCMLASLNSRKNLRAAARRDHILSDLSSHPSNSVRVQVPVVHTVQYTYDDRMQDLNSGIEPVESKDYSDPVATESPTSQYSQNSNMLRHTEGPFGSKPVAF